jgi:hypothetical protein
MPGERDDEIENGRTRGGLSEIMKKALFAGIGAVFMTEESVRSYVSDAKLPRDIRNYIIQNTTQAKEQFFGYLSKELSQIVIRSDLPKVIQRFLSDHTIELEAKIRFRSNASPELSGSAKATPSPVQAPPPASAVAVPPPAAPTPPLPPAAAPPWPATTSAPFGAGSPSLPPREPPDLPTS